MANLKQDLLNNLGNEKYYDELELVRLAQEPNMDYKVKVDKMTTLLKKLAEVDLGTQLVGKYFQEPVAPEGQAPAPEVTAPAPTAEAPAPEQPAAPAPHQGQTHAE